jgi:hypothetical protein
MILSACGGGGGGSSIPQTPSATSQQQPVSPPSQVDAAASTVSAQVTTADRSAAATATNFKYHIFPVQKPGTQKQSVIYPADLVYFGGPVLAHVQNHNVYLNAPSTEWGNPQQFLNYLNNSTFIHESDQYVGTTANGRYSTGINVAVSHQYFLNIDNIVPQTDILAFLHAAAAKAGHGYGHIYHLFLPHGYDTCFDGTNICYSPDNLSTFAFCAYHASVTFGDSVGHVIFSVEPFQNVDGCQTLGPQPPPNGQLVDSTDSTLSHEYFEAITDPDPPSGWVNPVPGFPGEIGDLCRFFYSIIPLQAGHKFEIQDEYSNKVHGCVDT